MTHRSSIQNVPKGVTGVLFYQRLFSDIQRSPYVPTGLVIALRDVSEQQMAALRGELITNYGPERKAAYTLNVPGLIKRLDFTHPTKPEYGFPFRPGKAQSDVLLDIWENSSSAGYCGYVAGAPHLHEEIESWGNASPLHATIYLTTTLEERMVDRSNEFRRKMTEFILALPSDLPIKEVHRRVAEKDKSYVVKTRILSLDEIDYFLSTFLPDHEVSERNGYPELIKKA